MKTKSVTYVTASLNTSSLVLKKLVGLVPIFSDAHFHQQRHFEFFRF